MINKNYSHIKKIHTILTENKNTNEAENDTITCSIYYRNNTDGSIRWMWPTKIQKPVFLHFYNAATKKAKLISFLIRVLFLFRLQSLFASGKRVIQIDRITYNSFLDLVGDKWAMFTGTPGLNQSALFYGNQQFYKIAVGNQAKALLDKEFKQLSFLKAMPFKNMLISDAMLEDGVLIQNNIATHSKKGIRLTDLHWNVLTDLAEIENKKSSIRILPMWQQLETKLSMLLEINDCRIPKGLLNKLVLHKDSISTNKLVSTSYGHGDFTPWNTFIQKNKLAVIDWELAISQQPLLFDSFHFLYQQASLVEHIQYNILLKQLEQALQNPIAQQLIQQNEVDVDLHHKLYLLYISIYYLEVYAHQSIWHPQVYISLEFWNCAVSKQLQNSSLYSNRQLVLMDIFDYLHHKKYAALKWLGTTPDQLPEESDIDLCMDKPLSKAFKTFLQNHPLVSKLQLQRKSFMCTYSILLQDDSFISVDAIHSFKRKSLIMLDANNLLATTSVNSFGIKVPSVEQDFNYTWLFYVLNNAPIPLRYQKHFTFFSNKWRKEMNNKVIWKNLLGLRTYQELFDYDKTMQQKVVTQLSQNIANKGFRKVKNKIAYLLDTCKEVFFKKGFIITFSGVDGAGKSTIIEKVRHQIEKKYRRKVVVLRHRPSLLPMISGIKEGRRASELRSANSLPRLGNNKNTISSLFRFGYYYFDYLFGQFVIQIKYVWRGYVVLYDRYYFDFIHDGKRSNIVLPSAFTKIWYLFLLKPTFNFFLYADADIILERKKELDKNTIKQLTAKYLGLFKQYAKRYSDSKYISIQNENLSQTLQVIFNHVKQKAI